MNKINFYIILVFLHTLNVFSQSDSLKKVRFSAYAEMYYSYDFASPTNHEKSDFIYNHKRHNELNANLIIAKSEFRDKNIRANIALMAGNYAQYNLSSEPTWAQFIYEANVGVKLSKKSNLWLDAGIMPSHIGFESAIAADCWTLTRSLLAENSPYYETGVKINYINKKENLSIAGLYLNGWQKVKKPDFIQKPSFGMQINYKPSSKIQLNYSNFLGTDKPDSLNAFRSFHNFYLISNFHKKWGLIAGFDIGSDKFNQHKYGIWYSPVAILQYILNEKLKLALRGEYYFDKNQVFITTNTDNGFQTSGFSSNLDYKINEYALFRIEAKMFHSKDAIFTNNSTQNFSITTSLAARF